MNEGRRWTEREVSSLLSLSSSPSLLYSQYTPNLWLQSSVQSPWQPWQHSATEWQSTVGLLAFSSFAMPFLSLQLLFFLSSEMLRSGFHIGSLTPPSTSGSHFCLFYMSACLSGGTLTAEWRKSAVRRLIWSCQTYQSCLPAYLTFSDYDNHARPVWRDRILSSCKITPQTTQTHTHTPMPVYILHQPPLQTNVSSFSEALSFKRVLVSSVSALNVIWFIQAFAAVATEWDSEPMSTSRAHTEHNNDRMKKLSGFELKWSPWGRFSSATYFTGDHYLIIRWFKWSCKQHNVFSLSDNGSYLIIRNEIRSPRSLTNTLIHVYPLRWLMSFFNLCTYVKKKKKKRQNTKVFKKNSHGLVNRLTDQQLTALWAITVLEYYSVCEIQDLLKLFYGSNYIFPPKKLFKKSAESWQLNLKDIYGSLLGP